MTNSEFYLGVIMSSDCKTQYVYQRLVLWPSHLEGEKTKLHGQQKPAPLSLRKLL